MASRQDEDQGYSLRLDREDEKLLKSLAAKEMRTVKAVVQRAIRVYAGLKVEGR